ncbi:MAG: hypothetical protein AB201_03590 [Parcubacteria bacterium C7867-006]|nr:MAG: hypothetical protein AB201_03590 [Parcubacteria bacterium C7867-006]
MKILIATGIYPPHTSGPAQYAEKMYELWSEMGNKVWVKTYTIENNLPTGIRHIYYFLKILPKVISSDAVFALDTFSTGFPAVLASKIFGKKSIIRTGGDFLWEGYVERTGDMVLLKEFYSTSTKKFSVKEKIIFSLIKWTLNNVSVLIFSTEWQRDIFLNPYKLDIKKTRILENHFERLDLQRELNDNNHKIKNFIAGTRPLKWKNIDFLRNIFKDNDLVSRGGVIDLATAPHKQFLEKMSKAYAVILVSLGDISPHMIIDALSLNKPFIVTKENGIMNRIGEYALTVDPKNENDIKEKILWLLDENNYRNQVEKIKNFSFSHTWKDMAVEYINIFKE